MDKQATILYEEFLKKARTADRTYNLTGTADMGRVEMKLLGLGGVRGLVTGNFGEVPEATHALLSHLATSRVRVADITRSRRGLMRSEEAKRAVAISSLCCCLGLATVRVQCYSLHGCLETLEPSIADAVGRRWQAAGGRRRSPTPWLGGTEGVPSGQGLLGSTRQPHGW